MGWVPWRGWAREPFCNARAKSSRHGIFWWQELHKPTMHSKICHLVPERRDYPWNAQHPDSELLHLQVPTLQLKPSSSSPIWKGKHPPSKQTSKACTVLWQGNGLPLLTCLCPACHQISEKRGGKKEPAKRSSPTHIGHCAASQRLGSRTRSAGFSVSSVGYVTPASWAQSLGATAPQCLAQGATWQKGGCLWRCTRHPVVSRGWSPQAFWYCCVGLTHLASHPWTEDKCLHGYSSQVVSCS